MNGILDIFKALADEGRLRILRSVDQAELSVAELVQALEMPQSTVSRHLKPMREAGLVASRREGTSVFYNRGPLFRDAAFAQILNGRLKEIAVANRDAAAVERVLELRRKKSREFFDGIAGRYGTLTEPGGGSDLGSIKTEARRGADGWVLNGTKSLITNAPICDVAVVLAKVSSDDGETGAGLFVVERGADGFSTGAPIAKMGYRGSPTGGMVFKDCALGLE